MSDSTKKRKLSDRWRSGSPSRRSDWIILVALLMHIVDVFFGFDWAQVPVRLVFYFIGITMICFLLKDSWKQQLPYLAGVSVFLLFGYPGIQYLLDILNADFFIVMIINTIMLILPLMAVYLISIGISYDFDPEEQGFIVALFKAIFFFRFTQWVKIWMFIWLIIGVINIAGLAMTHAQAIPALPGAKMNPVEALGMAGEVVTRSIETFTKGVTSLFTGVRSTYQQYMNNTLGGYYTSRVEDTNRDKPGISITNFRSEGRYYEGNINEGYAANRITFAPRIIVKLFEEDVKNIVIGCVAYETGNRSNNVTGNIQGYDENTFGSQNTLSVYKQDQRTIFCRFNDGQGTILRAGRYSVEFTAEFNYTTWAYSNYIFMDADYLESLRASGEDPRSKYKIPEKIDSIHTMGPAMVGMRKDITAGLPIGLSTRYPNYVPVGITLDNNDKVNGEILNVNYFEIKIPRQFSLTDNRCSRSPTLQQSAEIPNYNSYIFSIPSNVNLQSYLTIDCDMISQPADAGSILGGSGGMALVTIATKVNYQYKLKSRAQINVEKDPVYRG